jgi:hypothetical protein
LTRKALTTRAKTAVDKLLKNGDTLFITLQNVSEFWNVCTRPKDKNGLGFSIAQTDSELSIIEQIFDFCPIRQKSIKTGANSSSNIPFPASKSTTQKSSPQ